MRRTLLLLTGLSATASFSTPPSLQIAARPVRSAPLASAPRRCAVHMKGDGAADENWNQSDDVMLAEYIAMRASAAQCGMPERVLQDLEEAWVLIFNLGKQDEGVYTLQGRAARAASYVLSFERVDDADRFAALLQAEGFDLATPLKWQTDQLASFCTAGEFEVSLVPQVSTARHSRQSARRRPARASARPGRPATPARCDWRSTPALAHPARLPSSV